MPMRRMKIVYSSYSLVDREAKDSATVPCTESHNYPKELSLSSVAHLSQATCNTVYNYLRGICPFRGRSKDIFGGSIMAIIVVAGQDLAFIDLVSATIEGLGHKAVLVESAVDVVHEIIEHQAAAAVLDEVMETYDGYEVAAMLRAEPEVADTFPILLLVALNADIHKLDRAGVTECFIKGRQSAEFADLLIKCLGDEAGISAADDDPVEFLEP